MGHMMTEPVAAPRGIDAGQQTPPAVPPTAHPLPHPHPDATPGAALILSTLGVVYGDIGTSPLYALRESLLHAHEHGMAETAVI